MGPGGRNIFHHGLNGKLHILCKAGCTPAITLQDLCIKAHARATQAAGQAHIVFRQAPHMVNNPEGNRKDAADPGIGGVLGINIALDNALTIAKATVHLL